MSADAVSYTHLDVYKRQHFHPGVNVGRGGDDTLFALAAGSVEFGAKGGRKVVNIVAAAEVVDSGEAGFGSPFAVSGGYLGLRLMASEKADLKRGMRRGNVRRPGEGAPAGRSRRKRLCVGSAREVQAACWPRWWRRRAPVSYTHLDVYKRQHPNCSSGLLNTKTRATFLMSTASTSRS